jgi:opacity protein-like surface antigen
MQFDVNKHGIMTSPGGGFVYRTLTLVAVLVVVITGPQSTHAQDAESTIYVGPVLGWSFPVLDLADVNDSGWSIGATGDYTLSENFAVGASVVFHKFDPITDIWTLIGTWSNIDVTLNVLQITAHGKFLIPMDRAQIRVFGGLGLYQGYSSVKGRVWFAGNPGPIQFDESDNETNFGMNGGAGIQIPAGRAVIDVNSTFHIVTDEDTSMFFGVSAGALFGF